MDAGLLSVLPGRGRRGMVKTATSQNGDKPKRPQVQSKRINLLSSIMDPISVLLTKFQLIQLCSFCSTVISFSPGISPGLLLQYSFRSNLDHEVHAVDEIVKVERSKRGCTEQH